MKHNWEYKRLGDVCEKGSSNLIQKNLEFSDTGFDVFGASGSLGKISYYQQEKPYIGIVKDGSGVGRCNVYPAKSSLIGTMQYILAKDTVTNSFLCYLLKSLNLSKYVNGAAIPHIYFKDYKKEIVPVPPKEVQKQIVTEFDKINEVIEDCHELLRNLDALSLSLFYDFFGDPITNPKGWETSKFESLCKLSAGGDKPSDTQKDKCEEKMIPVYSNGIENEGLYGYTSQPRIIEPSVTISGRGTLGVPFVRKKPFVPIIRLIVATPMSNMNITFLFYLIKLLNLKGKGAAIPQLTVPMIKDLLLPVPPLSLQEMFSSLIERIDAQKKAVEETIANLQTLLDSRKDYWFN